MQHSRVEIDKIGGKTIPGEEMIKHVHHDAIVAWANGAQIQYSDQLGKEWFNTKVPAWISHYRYRIKPEPVPDQVIYNGFSPREVPQWPGTLKDLQNFKKGCYPEYIITKLTIKTDENGKITKIVEVLE